MALLSAAVLYAAWRATWGRRRHAGQVLLRANPMCRGGPLAITFGLLCLDGRRGGLSSGYHALGTDRIGNDVLWHKRGKASHGACHRQPPSPPLPPAIGWHRGGLLQRQGRRRHQYLYTTISIPGVLLMPR